jgi:hypothetical protein
MHCFVALSALVAIAWAEPVNAQQVRAGVLTCDVSEGMGCIIGSQKLLSCSFAPEGPGRREDYDGSITKFGRACLGRGAGRSAGLRASQRAGKHNTIASGDR